MKSQLKFSSIISQDSFKLRLSEFLDAFNNLIFAPWMDTSGVLGPECLENIFSRSLIKTTHQRKLRQTKCLLLNFWMIKFAKFAKKTFGTGNFAKLVLWTTLSLEREKIFYTHSRPWLPLKHHQTSAPIWTHTMPLYALRNSDSLIKLKCNFKKALPSLPIKMKIK